MSKIRLLKKDISYIAGELFTEVVFNVAYIPNVDNEKSEQLMTRILDMLVSFRNRAGACDAKNNKKLVRVYYRKLWEDLKTEVEAIGAEIDKLNKKEEEA